MTKFCLVYLTWATTAYFSYFLLELNVDIAFLAWATLRAIGVPNRSRQSRFRLQNINSLFTRYCPRRRCRRCLSSLLAFSWTAWLFINSPENVLNLNIWIKSCTTENSQAPLSSDPTWQLAITLKQLSQGLPILKCLAQSLSIFPHPQPPLFLHRLLLSLWCFSTLPRYYFQVSFIWIFYATNVNQNIVPKLLQELEMARFNHSLTLWLTSKEHYQL